MGVAIVRRLRIFAKSASNSRARLNAAAASL